MKVIKYYAYVLAILGFVFLSNCNKDDCEYSSCAENCNSIEDFEDDSTGTSLNWSGIALNSNPAIISRGGSNVLFADDGSGASWVYNTIDFPTDLVSQGCELQYDVEYLAGSSNSVTTDNSITVFQGTSPSSFTNRASFELNPSSLVVSGAPATTIVVPLEFATGTTLPSNSFGTWVMTGGPPYSPTQIADFNSLMQGNNGIGFFVDEGANPVEKWYYDNFCIKTCCPAN